MSLPDPAAQPAEHVADAVPAAEPAVAVASTDDGASMPGRSTTGWWSLGPARMLVRRHDPLGPARGVVVVVAPPSSEALTTNRTERVLAARLVERGYAVVRTAFTGTSHSTLVGPDDRPVAQRWEDEAVAVLDHAAQLYGVPSVSAVGTRLSATLLLNAAHRTQTHVDTVVALAPVGSGRTYLRALSQLIAMNMQGSGLPLPAGSEPDGVVQTYGIALDAASADHLRGYGLRDAAPEGTAVHVFAGPDKPLDKAARVFAQGEGVSTHTEPGLGAMLDRVSSYALVPADVVAAAVDAVTAGAGDATVVVPEPDPVRAQLVPGTPGVEAEAVDVDGMPGLLVLPVGDVRRVLVWSPGATEPTEGPGGLWATMAQRLARYGIATVMVDLEDSGERTRLDRPVDTYPYDLERSAELARAVTWAQRRFGLTPDLGGLCAGAWLALSAAAQVPVRTVVPVNPEQWTGEPSVIERIEADPRTGLPPASRREIVEKGAPAEQRLDLDLLRYRARRAVKEHVPYRVRLELGRRNRIQAPEPFLDAATRCGASVRALLTDSDFGTFRRLHGDLAAARLQRAGRDIVLEIDANTDHGMVTRYTRERVQAFVLRALAD